jgi:hypothetical protein
MLPAKAYRFEDLPFKTSRDNSVHTILASPDLDLSESERGGGEPA